MERRLRTCEGNNGWSRVEYDGQVLYCVSSLLTSDLSYTPPKEEKSEFKTKFTSVSEQVTAKDVTNLRNRPSVEEPSQVIAELYHGEIAVRTGISDVGWSRVEYMVRRFTVSVVTLSLRNRSAGVCLYEESDRKTRRKINFQRMFLSDFLYG